VSAHAEGAVQILDRDRTSVPAQISAFLEDHSEPAPPEQVTMKSGSSLKKPGFSTSYFGLMLA
jgi:hypothetical protein